MRSSSRFEAPPPDRWERLTLLTFALVFVALRLALVLCASDRISEPDSAEVKLMAWGDGWSTSGWPGGAEWLRMLRSGPMAPHGGTWLVTGLYALATLVSGPGSYLALKVVAVGIQAVGASAWVVAARFLVDRRAALVAALLLLLAPPGLLGPSLVPWGSHPEAAALLGIPAALLARGAGSAGVGFALGAVGSLDLLALPAVLALMFGRLWTTRWRERIVAASFFAAPVAGMLILTGVLGASVTEDPSNTPGALIRRIGGGGSELLATLLAATRWGVAAPALAGVSLQPVLPTLDRIAVGALFLGAAHSAWARPALRGLLAAVLVHLVAVVLLAPRRPDLPVRYLLLPWTALLVISAARPLLALPQALAGLLTLGLLLDLSRAGGFRAYDPARWLRHDLAHLRYEDAPLVNRFLDLRGDDPRGFEIVTGTGAAESLLLEPPPPPFRAAPVQQRLRAVADRLPAEGPQRRRQFENLGWGLLILGRDQPGEVGRVLASLGSDRWDADRGLGEAAAALDQCTFLGSLPGVDQDAARGGGGGCR